MEEDRNRKQKGDLLVGITAMSSAANLLMAQWIIDGHTEAELDELIEALTIYLKNASVEGIDYDQQAKWILRSVETGLGFFKSFRQKSKQRTGPARSSRPASRHALRPNHCHSRAVTLRHCEPQPLGRIVSHRHHALGARPVIGRDAHAGLAGPELEFVVNQTAMVKFSAGACILRIADATMSRYGDENPRGRR